jgi:sucrose-6-phosphate hydrolase SacC (GH32 family)
MAPIELAGTLLAGVFAISALTAAAQTVPYDQPYRPQVHFSPREHWTNDPNGLVYFRGEYHLFFQFNPFGDEWGHMSWGHAVSRDLLHWQELPVAIPEKDGEMVFTGSVVVDRKNRSGFCAPGTECLVAVYTGHRSTKQETRQTQNIAYSRDDGRTWTRYAANPVLDLNLADFRDPNVSWTESWIDSRDEKQGHWLMAVALPKQHKVRFYSSPNLKEWTQLSDFGPAGDVNGDWECPDLLRIPGEKGTGDMWALKVGLNPGAPQGGSGEQYFLGDFDGKKFTASREPGSHGWTNYGKDDYCAISFNGLPTGEKPVLIGWMSNWQYAATLPTFPWRGQMSLPRRLGLVRDDAGLALVQDPVIAPLRADHSRISTTKGGNLSGGPQQAPFELDLQFGRSSEPVFGIRIYTDEQHWTEIGFDRSKGLFYMDRTNSGAAITPDFPARTTAPLIASRSHDLKLIVDRSSVEAFAQSGTIAMTNLIFPPSRDSRIAVFSASGKAIPVKGDGWKLRSIWK